LNILEEISVGGCSRLCAGGRLLAATRLSVSEAARSLGDTPCLSLDDWALEHQGDRGEAQRRFETNGPSAQPRTGDGGRSPMAASAR